MILKLTLKKQWFDEIAAGTKKTEYREVKDYWAIRLVNQTTGQFKKFDEVHFRNGYGKDAPFMRVKCLGITREEGLYHIALGKVLEIKR